MTPQMERIREVAGRLAESLGLELVDVDLRGGGKARMLRVTIDRPWAEGNEAAEQAGVTHHDCANLSRELGTLLDVEDLVPGASYTLEVTSPGLDRKLVRPADYRRFAGSRVKLTTREPVDGNRYFEGRLEGFSDERIRLDLAAPAKKAGRREQQHRPHEPRQVEIALENVERANLVPEF